MNISKKDYLFIIAQARTAQQISDNLFKFLGEIEASDHYISFGVNQPDFTQHDIDHNTRILNKLNQKEDIEENVQPEITQREENLSSELCVQNIKLEEKALHVINNRNPIKRKDGRWELRDKIDGKWVTTACYSSKNKTIFVHNEKMREYRGNHQNNSNQAKKIFLFDWLLKFMELKLPTIAKSTYIGNMGTIRNHIVNTKMNIELKKITPMFIEEMLLTANSLRIREDMYNILSGAMRKAYNNKLIKDNPMDAVPKIVAPREKRQSLSKVQQIELFKIIETYSNPDIKPYYYFVLNSGARPDEGLRMKWSYVNFDIKTVFLDGTKNQTASRYIPLFPELEKIIQNIKPKKGIDKIFPFSYTVLRSDYQELQKHLNFKFTPYVLRHTFATRAYENGVDMKVISKWMGHTRLSTTEKIYVDILSEHENNQAAKFNPNL